MCRLLRVAFLWFVGCWVLCTVYVYVCLLLFVACCLLCVAWCLSFVVWCVLIAVRSCWWLVVVVCFVLFRVCFLCGPYGVCVCGWFIVVGCNDYCSNVSVVAARCV